MQKRCAVITGGELDLGFARGYLGRMAQEMPCDVIAVDAGLKKADALGVAPVAVVGDFDSVDPVVLAKYRALPGRAISPDEMYGQSGAPQGAVARVRGANVAPQGAVARVRDADVAPQGAVARVRDANVAPTQMGSSVTGQRTGARVDGKVILWLERGSEKDETDTVLALVLAVSLGYGRIDILGALGGRVDHALANIEALLWCMRAGVEAYIVDPRNRVRAVGAQSHGACVEFTAADSYGRYISFIPMSDAVTGVTLEGFRYPLHDKTLVPGAEPGLCVSNELAGEAGRLRFSSGTLLCIESRD